MLVILFWAVTFLLGANYLFAQGFALIPDMLIGKISQLFSGAFLLAIALFFVWCFGEE